MLFTVAVLGEGGTEVLLRRGPLLTRLMHTAKNSKRAKILFESMLSFYPFILGLTTGFIRIYLTLLLMAFQG